MMKASRRPVSRIPRKRRDLPAAKQARPGTSDALTSAAAVRTQHAALRRELRETVQELRASRRELADKTGALARERVNLRQVRAHLVQLCAEPQLVVSSRESRTPPEQHRDQVELTPGIASAHSHPQLANLNGTRILVADDSITSLHSSVVPAREREALDAPKQCAPETWPSIAGVDTKLSYDSCRGDRNLLLRALGQLCVEREALRAFEDDPAIQARLPAYLHALQASAGTVGAQRISAVAQRTLAATKLGREQGLSAVRHELIPEIEKLYVALAPLMAAIAVEPDALAPMENADQLLQALRTQLEEQRLDALDLFDRTRAALSARLPLEHMRSLQHAIENLEFERALGLLDN